MKLNENIYYLIYAFLLNQTYKFNLLEYFDYFTSELSNMLNWIKQYNSLKGYDCEGMMKEDYPELYNLVLIKLKELINI